METDEPYHSQLYHRANALSTANEKEAFTFSIICWERMSLSISRLTWSILSTLIVVLLRNSIKYLVFWSANCPIERVTISWYLFSRTLTNALSRFCTHHAQRQNRADNKQDSGCTWLCTDCDKSENRLSDPNGIVAPIQQLYPKTISMCTCPSTMVFVGSISTHLMPYSSKTPIRPLEGHKRHGLDREENIKPPLTASLWLGPTCNV